MTKGNREATVPPIASSFLEGDVPAGWVACTMGDVADVVGGGTPKANDPSNFDDDGHPWITPADLSGFSRMYIKQGSRSLSDRGLRSCSAKLLPPGTVLMSSRAPIGYLAIAAAEVSTNQGFKSFVCKEGIHPEYIYYWLKFATPLIEEMGSGSTFTEVSGGRCREIPLLLAPTNEQKRIAKKVEELLARVNAARERLARVPAILKRFRQSVLAAACSGRLTADWRNANSSESGASLLSRIAGQQALTEVSSDEDPIEPPEIPPEWAWSRCEHICDPTRSFTYGIIKLGPPVDDGIPTLRSSDVRWLYIDERDVKRVARTLSEQYKRTVLIGGEVLVTVRGTLGGVAVVPPHLAGFNVSREVAVLPLLPELDPQYFCYSIGMGWSQQWLSEKEKGVAFTGVNIRDLKRLPVPVPPLDEQREIVRRARRLLSQADAVENALTAGLRRVETLTETILDKAFRGELVQTEADLAAREDRDYEPASVLLARIQEARNQHEGAGQGRGDKNMAKHSTRRESAKSRRSLDEVLREHGRPLPPDRLFDLAGFDEDSVDGFYEHLRKLIREGKIREDRPNKKDVYLEAVGT